MTIEKRGNKYRIKQMRDGVVYYVNVDHKPSKREAEDLIREEMSSNPFNVPCVTFEDAYAEYVALKSNVLSESTKRGYRGIVNGMPDWFKQMKIPEIGQIEVQKLVNDHASTHSPKTTRNMHGLVSAVLTLYKPDLSLHTTMPQKNAVEPYIPSTEEIRAILDYVKDTKYECAYALATLSCRRSEICAITSDDLTGNILHITRSMVQDENEKWVVRDHNKNDTSTRDIYLPDRLVYLINENGKAFDGMPWELNQHLQVVLTQLGIQKFSFHKFRHYFASYASTIASESDWLAMGGWKTDHIAKTVYRHAQNVAESQKEMSSHIASML